MIEIDIVPNALTDYLVCCLLYSLFLSRKKDLIAFTNLEAFLYYFKRTMCQVIVWNVFFLVFLTAFYLLGPQQECTYMNAGYTPLGWLASSSQALCEHSWVQYLAQGCFGSGLRVFWHPPTTRTPSVFCPGLEPRTLQFQTQFSNYHRQN